MLYDVVAIKDSLYDCVVRACQIVDPERQEPTWRRHDCVEFSTRAAVRNGPTLAHLQFVLGFLFGRAFLSPLYTICNSTQPPYTFGTLLTLSSTSWNHFYSKRLLLYSLFELQTPTWLMSRSASPKSEATSSLLASAPNWR